MMLTIAECYETGVYYHDPEVRACFISYSPNQARQIWRKYNSDLVEFSLRTLQQEPLSGGLLMEVSDELIEFKDARTVERLIEAIEILNLKKSQPWEATHIKGEAARILGKLGDSKAVPTLIPVLEDCYYATRSRAAEALGQLRDKRATDSLIVALSDRESEVRQTAARALGKIQDPKAAKPLIDTLYDSDNWVTEAARNAFSRSPSVRTFHETSLHPRSSSERETN